MLLKDEALYEQVRILNLNKPGAYKSGPNEGEEFCRAVCNGTVFTVDIDVANAFAAGELASMNLIEGTRVVNVPTLDAQGQPVIEDGKEVTEPKTVKTLTYDGSLTFDQLATVVEKSGKITRLRESFKVAVATAPVDTVA